MIHLKWVINTHLFFLFYYEVLYTEVSDMWYFEESLVNVFDFISNPRDLNVLYH